MNLKKEKGEETKLTGAKPGSLGAHEVCVQGHDEGPR